jgi:dCMP deaminase
MQIRFKQAFMDVAKRFAELSHAKRLHVGAIVVKDDRIISIGYNGIPSGWDNTCEDKVWDSGAGGWLSPEEFDEQYPYEGWHQEAGRDVRYGLKTKPEVLHAETNAIAKLARSSESGFGADLFVTHSPCLDCAKIIYQSGIKRVYFGTAYRNNAGVDFLKNSGVEVEQLLDKTINRV